MLSYKGYVGQVAFDPQAKVFYGTVINTRDKITFQSEHARQLEQEFQTSVETYLAFCKELGEEAEKPYLGRFVLRLSPEGHRTVALAAQLSHKSLNTWAAEHLVECAQQEMSNQSLAFDSKGQA